MGAFGLSVHILCGDKMPKAGGQGILGSGRRIGPDVVLWERAWESGAEVLVSSMEASLPGPLSGSLWAPHSADHCFQGYPHPFSDLWG